MPFSCLQTEPLLQCFLDFPDLDASADYRPVIWVCLLFLYSLYKMMHLLLRDGGEEGRRGEEGERLCALMLVHTRALSQALDCYSA